MALVENGWPSIGVIHAPDHQLTYYAQNNLGAFKENDTGSHQIHVAKYDGQRRIKVAISRRQDINLMGQYLNSKYDFEHIALGSCTSVDSASVTYSNGEVVKPVIEKVNVLTKVGNF